MAATNLRPLRGGAIPRTGAGPGRHTSHRSSTVADASTASARLEASGMPPSPIRRTNHAGASTAEPAGACEQRDHGGGPEPAGQHDGRARARLRGAR